MAPSRNVTTRVAYAAIEGSWVTTTTVMPCPCRAQKSSMTCWVVAESSAPVGSSARRSGGSLTMARAMATRCCWPPESWFGRWCDRSASPTRARARAARSRRSAGRTPA
ncbi:hypothetical protein BE20_12440 [Sorangium cellulosum]|nr:hypothetical protein BE20_12440 [Sorangium cellulosum]